MEDTQQSDGPSKGSPGPSEVASDIGELLFNKDNLDKFIKAAYNARLYAVRGHESFIEAGRFYLTCQLLIQHGKKAAWFEAEAKAINCTTRTIYNYITLAEAADEDNRKLEAQAMFMALSQEDKDKRLDKVWHLAELENKSFNEAKAKAAKVAASEKAAGEYLNNPKPGPAATTAKPSTVRTEPVRLSGGGEYPLTFPRMPEAMRAGLDTLTKSQNWEGAARDIMASIAVVLVRYGIGTDVKEFLQEPYLATDGDIPV